MSNLKEKKELLGLFGHYKVVRDKLLSDKNLSKEQFEERYQEDIAEMDRLFEERNKRFDNEKYIAVGMMAFFVMLIFYSIYTTNKIDEMKWYVNASYDLLDIRKDSLEKEVLHYMEKNDKRITYADLVKNNDSLRFVCDSLRSETYLLKSQIRDLEFKQNMINDRYDISVKKVRKNDSINIFTISSPSLDSAMILFPYYKHKIRFFNINNGVVSYSIDTALCVTDEIKQEIP